MNIKKNLEFFKSPVFIVIAAMVIVVMYVLGVKNYNETKQFNERIGLEYISPDSAAITLKDNKSFSAGDNSTTDSILDEDLAYFARHSYKEYNPKTNPQVIFDVASKTNVDTNKIKLVGKFRLTKEEVTVAVEIANYGRINSSIIATKTKRTLDAELPSNNPRDQFIGKLPVYGGSFIIDYNPMTDMIYSNLYSQSAASKTEALNMLKAGLKKEILSDSEYSISYPVTSTNNSY
ncbi:MAG: hypothetical protein WCJ86_03665 [Candidatus Saccharibacteria bacterium]